MVLIESILTIIAWRKGWGFKAVIPGVLLLAFVFIIGVLIAYAGGDVQLVNPLLPALDFGLIGVLSLMIAKPPSNIVTDINSEVVEKEGEVFSYSFIDGEER